MKSILTLTDKAKIQLKKILKNAPEQTHGFILGLDKSGCNGHSYKLDFADEHNAKSYEYINIDEIKIYIDPKATMFLLGTEMDYEQDKLSSRFVFNNPNEKGTCGCGESISF